MKDRISKIRSVPANYYTIIFLLQSLLVLLALVGQAGVTHCLPTATSSPDSFLRTSTVAAVSFPFRLTTRPSTSTSVCDGGRPELEVSAPAPEETRVAGIQTQKWKVNLDVRRDRPARSRTSCSGRWPWARPPPCAPPPSTRSPPPPRSLRRATSPPRPAPTASQ